MCLPVQDVAQERSHLYLWVPNALLPEGLSGRTVSIGNAAGTGACRILQSAGLAEEARQIAAAAQVVELSVSSFFRKRYIESMNFPPPR